MKLSLLKSCVLLFLSALGLAFLWINIENHSINYFLFFSLFVLGVSFLAVSNRLISPVNIVIGYYVIWYVLAPNLASGYQDVHLDSVYYRLAEAFIFSTFVFILFSIKFGEYFGGKLKLVDLTGCRIFNLSHYKNIFYTLLIVSTILVVAVVLASGGFEVWLANPGDAFLNRAGSGVYVVLSHFTSIALALVAGYIFYETRKLRFLLMVLVWVVLTSPVHGSKFQISLLFMVSFLPFLVKEKTFSSSFFVISFAIVSVFIVGMFFRGFEGGSVEHYLSLFNYFSTLHNFALVIKDVPPGEYFTFFYPFNKFLIFLGVSDHNYFNINHLLTDIYYPHAWEIRATEQWPLEADLYINFYYIWGLPFVFMYYGFVGLLFGLAKKYNNLGLWFLSFMMTIFLVGHLRDGLYNFNDFYLIPYFLIVAYFFRSNTLHKQA